ncbi:MAG: metallophosphoesterase family protein [Dehalococcoidales bacterium]|nr:MAG: metallophosphoesterase family protein [Dehalococcoidales bacterium]
MDRIAIISDIHGNMPALEAVLQDIRGRDIERILCLGDLVGKGPHSDRAVDICREVCEQVIMGNWDDYIRGEPNNPMKEWHQQRLGSERLEYLKDLPYIIEFYMSGKKVRLFHASNKGIYDRVFMDDTRESHRGMFNNTDFTGDAFVPDVVGYGDIHSAYLKSFRQRTLFNTGSVGNPLDLTMASYIIMEGEYGSEAGDTLSIQIIRVPYDVELAIQQARDEGMPELEAYESELRTTRYRALPPPEPKQG